MTRFHSWSLAVLNFRTPAQARRLPNYLSRSTQRRLLGLVLAFGAVVWLLSWAANPDNFTWINRLAEKSKRDPTIIDTRLGSGSEGPLIMASGAPKADKHESAARRNLLPGIDLAMFKDVRDDTPLRTQEMPVASQMFQVLDELTDEEAKELASSPVTFVQLYTQPEAYRGELVRIEGTVRSAMPAFLPLENEDQQQCYEVILQPLDRDDPIVAYCLRLPIDFPTGRDISQRASLTGLFFKRWAYRDKSDAIRSAPLILARDFEWRPAPATADAPQRDIVEDINYLLIGAGLIALVLAVVVWQSLQRKTRHPAAAAHHRGDFESLRNLEVAPDVREALSKLDSSPPASSGPSSSA